MWRTFFGVRYRYAIYIYIYIYIFIQWVARVEALHAENLFRSSLQVRKRVKKRLITYINSILGRFCLYVFNLFRGSLQDMSFSERVLYRMLSGMHASINIHISETYYPPSKLRPNWEPNLDKFARNFGDSPERLKNLHFAFI